MAKKSLSSIVSMFKSAKIKSLRMPKARKPFKVSKVKFSSSLKLRVGK